MEAKEIIEAFENLRYFESTDEVEYGKVLTDADHAIAELKKILYKPKYTTFEQRIQNLSLSDLDVLEKELKGRFTMLKSDIPHLEIVKRLKRQKIENLKNPKL